MDHTELLEKYQIVARRLLLLEATYPALQLCSTVWADLPHGRPDDLSRNARYVLFCYRALLAERTNLWSVARVTQAAAWLAAVQAETMFAWQIEWSQHSTLRWLSPIPEFTAATITQVAA